MSKSAEESWRELGAAVDDLKVALSARALEMALYVGIVWIVLVLSIFAIGDWIGPLVPEWLCEDCQPQR